MQHQEALSVVGQVHKLKKDLPLLKKADLLSAQTDFLTKLLLAEFVEAEQELALEGTTDFSQHALAGEVGDMAVFTISMQMAAGRDLDALLKEVSEVNGRGTRADAFDVARELIENAADDPEALVEVFKIILSMLSHYSPVSAFETIRKTADKVMANRPPEFYTDEESGRVLTDTEALGKYGYLEKGMRVIRKAVGRTLVPLDWQQHRDLLHNWRGGEQNLELLNQRMEIHRVETTASGVHIPNPAQVNVYGSVASVSM